MKIRVTCGCGSTFQAPQQLAGQTVRCPSCRKPVAVPAAPGGASGGGGGEPAPPPDLSDLSALDQSSLDSSGPHGSTAGRTAINTASSAGSTVGRSAIRESVKSDQNVSREVDDRMSRLYEVYSGKKMGFGGGSGGKAKLLVGLGIAVMTIGLGVAVAWHFIPEDTLDSMSGIIAGEPVEVGVDAEAPVEAARVQHPDPAVQWRRAEPAQTSGAALAKAVVRADTRDGTRFTFGVSIVPAGNTRDRRLSMAASVALYRSPDAQGPFVQADRVKVEGYDRATGSLKFQLFDAELAGLATNQLYYRLSGFDSNGKRLFDTPSAGFAYVSAPVVAQGRVTWDPRAAGRPAPAMRIHARLDAPGWEDVLLWQVTADGPINQAMPDLPGGLPVVVESAVYSPTELALDGQGRGRWQRRWVGTEVHRLGKPGTPVVGAAPHADAGVLDYRLTPDEDPFTSVTRPSAPGDRAGRTRAVTFSPKGASAQTLTVTAPPRLTGVTATAYDGRVHLGWDSTDLLAGIERYDGTVEVAVRRVDEDGREVLIAQLPADSTGYTDTALANGSGVSYEVSLVQAGAAGAAPMTWVDAWVRGQGTLSVLASYPTADTTAKLTPQAGLDRLFVSLGNNELCYTGTGLAAVTLRDRLIEALSQTPGVVVVDRASLCGFVCATGGGNTLAQAVSRVGGSPAQVKLRLVDSTSSQGERLSLWATDVAAGTSRRLAWAGVGEAEDQAGLFVTALKTYLESCMPKGVPDTPAQGVAPRQVLVGPIFPVDQPALYYRTDELGERLAQAGDHANAGIAVVTQRFWLDDTQQDPKAIDPSVLRGVVLVTGRVWTAEGGMPAVSLHAVDAVSGRLIDRFVSAKLTPESVRAFARWCGTLRALDAAGVADGSPLLAAEAALDPIHTVWRRAATDPGASGGKGPGTSLADTGLLAGGHAPVLSFGLPLPPALSGLDEVVTRDPDHPLFALRPYVAPQHPLTFDRWAQAYADYIQADCMAFIEGFDQVRREQQARPGPIRPYLLIRGEHKFTGTDTIPPSAGGYRVTPSALNLRSFFPMGTAGQPMIDYRRGLSEAFRARPWASYHAWKRVSPGIAEPFLKGELYGVVDGRYGRLPPLQAPAPFYKYVAASLLAGRGNREAQAYRLKAQAMASKALAELIGGGIGRLPPEKMKWATDAVLVLVFEGDPGAVEQLSDPRFRESYFSVESRAQTDTLRMLVDQAGPQAWDWADGFGSVDWPMFSWRSRDEMDRVTQAKADTIPQRSLLAMRAWLELDSQEADDEPGISAASGPLPAPKEN
jgi:hypothetical protein